MGCGKSSVGRRLSGLTGHRFVDLDELIAQSDGRSISEIFSQRGGGIVLRPANRETLKRIGIVAWLDADPDILFERAMRSGRRPLLQTDDPKGTFDELLDARRNLYEMAADFRVDSSRLSHDEAAQTLLEEALRRYRRF